MTDMSKYSVRPSGTGGFDIAVTGDNGARNTMLGFSTAEDAKAWIKRDKRLNDPTDPFMSTLMMLRRDGGSEHSEMLTSRRLTEGGGGQRPDRAAPSRLPGD